jgi:hypothetical protein
MDSFFAPEAPGSPQSVAARGLLRAVERVRSRRSLRAARREADEEIAHRRNPPLRVAWRVEELVSTKKRLDLAHAFRSLVRDSQPRYLPTASPVNRGAVRVESETLLAIAARIGDVDSPVAAKGIVLADRMLTDGSGPLYDRERAGELHGSLYAILEALEPR